MTTLVDKPATAVYDGTVRRCYCPDDCNCHKQGPPFHRLAYCGCRGHDYNDRKAT